MRTARAEAYGAIVSHLHQDQVFERIVKGQLRVPDIERSLLVAFPPALIPLWSTGAQTIVGLWKHWLSTNRLATFVEFYGMTMFGKRNLVFERARTFRQLLYCHLYECITLRDGVDDQIMGWAKACGLDDVDDIVQVSLKVDDVTGLRSHPEFANNLPLSFYPDANQQDYAGDFPTRETLFEPATLRHCCVYEVHSGFRNSKPDYSFRDAVAREERAPAWFHTESQHLLFERFLQVGDLEGAWMCLNSPEWTVSNARRAMKALAGQANNPGLSKLADIWIDLPFPDDEVF